MFNCSFNYRWNDILQNPEISYSGWEEIAHSPICAPLLPLKREYCSVLHLFHHEHRIGPPLGEQPRSGRGCMLYSFFRLPINDFLVTDLTEIVKTKDPVIINAR